MKIICVAKNYEVHAVEMRALEPSSGQSNVPQNPVWFLKPDSALLQRNQPFFYPDFSNDIHHEVEIVVKIDRLGKSIEEKFAHRYYSSVSLGIDFTARDLQKEAKEKSQPWAKAKGFDGSAVLGPFISLAELNRPIDNIDFSLVKNGAVVQQGNTKDMLFSVNRIISYVSDYMTLKTGDLIYTGTPAGVGAVKIGDTLEGFIDNRKMFTCRVK